MNRHENNLVNRRDFMKLSAGALAAASLGGFGCKGTEKKSAAIPVGMQLYCVREECAVDFPGTLAKLAAMGYAGVEFADYFNRSAAELHQLLAENGLRSCGTHIYLNILMGDELQRTIDFNAEVGTKNLIIRWLNEDQHNSMDALLRTADQINEAAEKLKPHGMRVGYHNHGFDFETLDGKTKWDILADNTGRDVILQLDTGNASSVGPEVNVIDLLNRNPGRTVTIHVKPFSAANDAAILGEDELDWPGIFRICETTGGMEWYILEYEKEGIPPMEAMRMNLESMRKMGKLT